jgi:SAM-dependent methyltransferase
VTFLTWEEAVNWLIEQPDQQDLVRACYYDRPLKNAAERYRGSLEWQAIRPFLPQKIGWAVDLGAGNGIASYALAKDGWKVTALEPDPSDLVGAGAISNMAKTERLSIEVIKAAAENIPVPSETVNLVFARQVLHHAKDLRQVCREIFRVLKPAGVFLAAREHVISQSRDLPIFLQSHPLHRLYGGEHAYRLRDYVGAIRASGLKIRKILGPFDTIINYAPQDDTTLRTGLREKLRRYPGGKFLYRPFHNEWLFKRMLAILSQVDRRPGRLFSLVCFRPER